jgi:hypothetical protein
MAFNLENDSTQIAQFIVLLVFSPCGIVLTAFRFLATHRCGRKPGLEDWMAGLAALFFVMTNVTAIMCKPITA